jgi:hypothetical protein
MNVGSGRVFCEVGNRSWKHVVVFNNRRYLNGSSFYVSFEMAVNTLHNLIRSHAGRRPDRLLFRNTGCQKCMYEMLLSASVNVSMEYTCLKHRV